MKKFLTTTFRGLSTESIDIDKAMDPANKSREVGVKSKLILLDTI